MGSSELLPEDVMYGVYFISGFFPYRDYDFPFSGFLIAESPNRFVGQIIDYYGESYIEGIYLDGSIRFTKHYYYIGEIWYYYFVDAHGSFNINNIQGVWYGIYTDKQLDEEMAGRLGIISIVDKRAGMATANCFIRRVDFPSGRIMQRQKPK